MDLAQDLGDIMGFRYSNKQLNNKTIVRLVRMACDFTPANFFEMRGTDYPYLTLHIVHSGCSIVRIKDTDYLLEKGDAFIILPGEEHLYYGTEKIGYIWAEIDYISYSDVINHLENKYIIKSQYSGVLIKKLSNLLRFVKNNKNVSEYKISAMSYDLVMAIYEAVNSDYIENLSESVVITREYINKNFKENISISELAKISKVSQSLLVKKFKSQIGTSIGKYILLKKLEYAIFLLKNTNFSCNDIAEKVGLYDASQLTRMCKTHLKRLPSDFRKKSL
ncbi:MAG: AraC family transcriptional regulator [Clostridia bacterium]